MLTFAFEKHFGSLKISPNAKKKDSRGRLSPHLFNLYIENQCRDVACNVWQVPRDVASYVSTKSLPRCRGRRMFALDIFQPCSLAAQIAQVIKLGAPNFRRTHQVDAIDHSRTYREYTLHTLAEADLANGKASLRTARARQHHTLECLQALFVAFFDLDVNANSVARDELRQVGALGLRQQFFDD